MTRLVSEKLCSINKKVKKSIISINNKIFILHHRIKEILWYKKCNFCFLKLSRTSERNTSLWFVWSGSFFNLIRRSVCEQLSAVKNALN